jgi:hypothetical protein
MSHFLLVLFTSKWIQLFGWLAAWHFSASRVLLFLPGFNLLTISGAGETKIRICMVVPAVLSKQDMGGIQLE